jgi:predicted metal-dependent hydrolase
MDMPETMRIVRSFRRTMSMHFDRDGTLVVNVPRFTPDFVVRKFLDQHARWIEKHRKIIAQTPQKTSARYEQGGTFLYQGNVLTLDIGPYRTIEVKGDILAYPQALRFRIRKEIDAWYQKTAARVIRSFADEMASVMGVTYRSMYFSETRSKWGSCTHDNRLQFNWRLIMAPQLVLRYVVIHELAHITHKNHSRDFWRTVERYNPSFKQQIKWLKNNGGTIT